jgi:hypothetical protein
MAGPYVGVEFQRTVVRWRQLAAPESTIPICQQLDGGSWTEVDVDLAQIPPSKFELLAVSDVTAKSIALKK